MLKNLFFAAFFTLLCFSFSSAQNANTNNDIWEYLVVSVTNFNDKQNFNPTEKYIGRRQGNVGFYQDNLTQNEFDRLGKLGWELVGILPMNSGEQSNISFAKFIFKRPLNVARSQSEAEDLKKITEELKIPLAKTPDFVDADLLKAQSDQKQKEKEANEKIEQALKRIRGYSIISIKGLSWFPNKNDQRIAAEVVIDGTKELLTDGNKYSSSESRDFIRKVASEIFNVAELKPLNNQEFFQEYFNPNSNGVNIKLSVVIKNNEKTKTVAEGSIVGIW